MRVCKRNLEIALIFIAFTALYGCGGGTSGNNGAAVSKLQESVTCLGCHTTAISPGTGKTIGDEWNLSVHNTKNGAGCTDCHEPKAGHPNTCNGCHNGPGVPLVDEVVRNPDRAGKCDKCHGRGMANELPRSHYYDAKYDALPTSKPTWNNMSTVAWVTSKSQNNCNWCHNPHDTTITQQHKDWAESGHGDINGAAWRTYDFKARNRATTGASPATSVATDCIRCHSTTGYLNYITSGFRNISSWADPGGLDRGKQNLYCNACHIDGSGRSYGYRMRNVPQVTGFYNYSVRQPSAKNNLITPALKRLLVSFTYPSVGDSNICMVCHVGRENGDTLKAIDAQVSSKLSFAGYSSYYRNLGFVNSHYLTAGATIFKASGYEYTGLDYNSNIDRNNNSHYMHDQIGRFNTNNTGTSGPCVTCHLKPGRHTLKPLSTDTSGNFSSVISPVCANCHDSANPMTEAIANTERAALNSALAALKAMLAQNNIFFKDSNPYFFTSATGNTGFTRWRKIETMGAAFNYNLLAHDPGAFAHNRLYVKRLVHDAIDWLYTGSKLAFGDNGTFMAAGNVEAAINALPVSTSFTTQDKVDAIKYLLGGPGGIRP
jgi:hypothetical protein